MYAPSPLPFFIFVLAASLTHVQVAQCVHVLVCLYTCVHVLMDLFGAQGKKEQKLHYLSRSPLTSISNPLHLSKV